MQAQNWHQLIVPSQDRDSPRPLPNGTTDQDLVSEPADEVEEGTQNGEHERDADAPDAPGSGVRPPPSPPGRTAGCRRVFGWISANDSRLPVGWLDKLL